MPMGKAFGESSWGQGWGLRGGFLSGFLLLSRLLKDSRLFVDSGVPAATGRALSSRETLSHPGAVPGLPVMTASLVGAL